MTARIEEFPVEEGEFPPSFMAIRAMSGYFATMGVPIIEGREFILDDHNSRLRSLIISESIKREFWPDVSALYKRIRHAGAPARVVGVVGDVHDTGMEIAAEQFVYKPMLDPTGGGRLALGADAGTVRKIILSQGMLLAVLGVAAALAGAMSLGGVMSSLLVEVSPADPAHAGGRVAHLLGGCHDGERHSGATGRADAASRSPSRGLGRRLIEERYGQRRPRRRTIRNRRIPTVSLHRRRAGSDRVDGLVNWVI